MDDTKKILVKLLAEAHCKWRHGHGASSMAEAFGEYLANNGVTVQQWIPVAERLPEQSGFYLALCQNGCIERLHYSVKHNVFNAYDDLFPDKTIPCTHWMPLPDPPKKGE